jgi:hypothetical protein
MSIGALSNATALTILTTTYSLAGGQTSSLSKGDSKALAGDPLLASLGAPTSSADFFVVAHASQNAVMTTIVNTGLNKTNANPQALNHYESFLQQAANTYLTDNEMTSQRISDALYSGQGIPVTPTLGANATMADELNGLDLNATEIADAAGISTAFQNHTLTIQKATDVQGLDYSETMWGVAYGNGGGGGISSSYSQAFLNADADGKRHLLESGSTGGNVMLYLTW